MIVVAENLGGTEERRDRRQALSAGRDPEKHVVRRRLNIPLGKRAAGAFGMSEQLKLLTGSRRRRVRHDKRVGLACDRRHASC